MWTGRPKKGFRREDFTAWHFWGQAGGEQGPLPQAPKAKGHESWGSRGSPESDCPIALSPRQRSQHGVGPGEGNYGDFPPSLGRSPSAGVRSEQPTASWSSVKSPAGGRIPRCVYLPLPPPQLQPAFTRSPPAGSGQGCQMPHACVSWRGGAGFCPPLLFLGLERQPSHSTSSPERLFDCSHLQSIQTTIPLFRWSLVTCLQVPFPV